MKPLLVLAVFAATANQVAAFNIQDVRRTFVADCSMRGISKGEDPERVAKFCSCTFDVLSTGMTVAEYLEVDRVGQSGGTPERLPQMQRLMPKIATQCKPQ